jgi:hypothetical protein
VGDELFHELNDSVLEDFLVITVFCEMTIGAAYTTIA